MSIPKKRRRPEIDDRPDIDKSFKDGGGRCNLVQNIAYDRPFKERRALIDKAFGPVMEALAGNNQEMGDRFALLVIQFRMKAQQQ